jgi:RNA polymerase sigma-70 factor (ECF subfamily)
VRVAEDAWQAWVERYEGAALLYARQWVRSAADAEDVVQEAFVRFWRVRERARTAGLLFAAVRTAGLDFRRGERRRKRREAAGAREAWFVAGAEVERREEVARALAGLPEEQREAVVLKIWGGLTFGEIAAVTGAGANTAAGRYRYGIEKLAAALATEVRRG